MGRLNCSYDELMDTPPWVVQDALIVMRAEARIPPRRGNVR